MAARELELASGSDTQPAAVAESPIRESVGEQSLVEFSRTELFQGPLPHPTMFAAYTPEAQAHILEEARADGVAQRDALATRSRVFEADAAAKRDAIRKRHDLDKVTNLVLLAMAAFLVVAAVGLAWVGKRDEGVVSLALAVAALVAPTVERHRAQRAAAEQTKLVVSQLNARRESDEE